LGVSPGSGSRWVSKRIPLDAIKHLLQQLNRDFPDILPVMLWGPDEAELIRELAPLRHLYADLGNNLTLEEYMSLVSCCDYLLTTDSLTMHLGLGYGVPVLAVFRTTPASEIKMFDRGVRIATSDPRYASMHPTQELTLGLEPPVIYSSVISLLRQFFPGRNR
jgi:heptosyltransferase-2